MIACYIALYLGNVILWLKPVSPWCGSNLRHQRSFVSPGPTVSFEDVPPCNRVFQNAFSMTRFLEEETSETHNDNVGLAFLLVICAGLSTGVGAAFVFSPRLVSKILSLTKNCS